MTIAIRPWLRQHAGGAAVVLAAVALVVGPMAALAASSEAGAKVEALDERGTQPAQELADAFNTAEANSRERYANALSLIADLDRRLTDAEARLHAIEAANAEALAAAHHEAVEVEEDAHDPTGIEAAAGSSEDRWDALAACESTGDTDGVAPHRIDFDPDGYFLTSFQFDPAPGGTAEKVGAYRGMPYDDAKAAAQTWAARDDVDASTTAGWPTCWPLVMGDTPT